MRARVPMLVAIGSAATALLAFACDDSAELVPVETPPVDASIPEASLPDRSETEAAPADAAPFDASRPAITCSVSPCAVSLATAGSSTCALLSDGTVRCWGVNDNGQLGRGPIEAGEDSSPAPVIGLSGATQLSGGPSGYCVTLTDATVKCWGANDVGQLGGAIDGGAGFSATPRAIPKVTSARAAFMGDGLACAALTGGDAMCWGNGDNGRIPGAFDAASGTVHAPTLITLGKTLRTIAPGPASVVALADDGSLVSWGKRSRPLLFEVTTLGREVSIDPAAPASIPSPTSVDLLAGWGPVAAATSAGDGFHWGQLSGPVGPVTPTPITFATVARVLDIALGNGNQLCAVLSDKTARCLGDNTFGQLGTGDYAAAQVVPVVVAGLPASPARVSTGALNACAIVETGAVYCWGYNARGELGTGDYVIHPSPTLVRLAP